MPHRPQNSAGPILQPEVSASSLKLLPDTAMGHFHFSPEDEVCLFALRLSTTEFSRKQSNYSHKVTCLFLFKFSAYLNHAFSLFDWSLTLIYNNDDFGRVQSWHHFYIIVTCEHQRIQAFQGKLVPGDVPLPHVRPIVHSFEVNEEVNDEAPSLGPIMTSPSPKGQTRHLHVGTFFLLRYRPHRESISPSMLLGCSHVLHTWSDKFGKCGATQGCLGFLTNISCGFPGRR